MSRPGPFGAALIVASVVAMWPAASEALTPAQCVFFAVQGKTEICHSTGSATNPFTRVTVSQNACSAAHALHGHDFIAFGDPACDGSGCLPAGAPVDDTVPCCEGLTPVDGVCAVPACLGGTFAVTVSGTGFMDEIGWTLTGDSASNVGSGGPYGFASTNMVNVITSDVPLTFDIETMGFFNDNNATFTIQCGGAVVATGFTQGSAFGGPNAVNVPGICCGVPAP